MFLLFLVIELVRNGISSFILFKYVLLLCFILFLSEKLKFINLLKCKLFFLFKTNNSLLLLLIIELSIDFDIV